jgi:hypothetical protein
MLFSLFVALAGVSGRKLDCFLCRDPSLELTTALDFCVELCAEEQGDVRNPHPEQKRDNSTDRAVRLVVTREVRDVEPEPG